MQTRVPAGGLWPRRCRRRCPSPEIRKRKPGAASVAEPAPGRPSRPGETRASKQTFRISFLRLAAILNQLLHPDKRADLGSAGDFKNACVSTAQPPCRRLVEPGRLITGGKQRQQKKKKNTEKSLVEFWDVCGRSSSNLEVNTLQQSGSVASSLNKHLEASGVRSHVRVGSGVCRKSGK